MIINIILTILFFILAFIIFVFDIIFYRLFNNNRSSEFMITKERYNQLMNDPSEKLTLEEIKEGWHFCNDWDGLLIHKNDQEFDVCNCQEV